MDREPSELEAALFDATPASQWNEHNVFIDVPATRKHLRRVYDSLQHLPGLLTPLG